ncbi:MAG: hypothetical protein ACU0CA_09160 [Paracoccaceae bacterium]
MPDHFKDPTIERRQKLVAGIEEQLKVAEAVQQGKNYEVKRQSWSKDEQGEKVLVERMRKVRAWFFEQDDGWYVQCKYGNKALVVGDGNAVFVKALKDVQGALNALKSAAGAGEFDDAVTKVLRRKKSK